MKHLPSAALSLGLLFASASSLGAASLYLTENFDSVASLSGNGWLFQNNSVSPNSAGAWRQGSVGSSLGLPPSGALGSFALSSATATSLDAPEGANLNDWMLTPVVTLTNESVITFYTRTYPANEFPERLQILITTTGPSSIVGSTSLDVGDYTTQLLEINPSLLPGGTNYPDTWTQFSIDINGLSAPIDTRIAFRHFVTDSGLGGPNGDGIGIDSLVIVPEPSSVALVAGLATLAGAGWLRRRKSF